MTAEEWQETRAGDPVIITDPGGIPCGAGTIADKTGPAVAMVKIGSISGRPILRYSYIGYLRRIHHE
nr:MAG TPA: hypothetical protein [Caudoviricetes sp.]